MKALGASLATSEVLQSGCLLHLAPGFCRCPGHDLWKSVILLSGQMRRRSSRATHRKKQAL